jgi:RiboL-PSP-HEPN
VRALDAFQIGLNRARALGGLFTALSQTTTPALDLTDLLRAEIVLAVSAFDHFIHEIARQGALESFQGKRPTAAALLRFDISVDSLLALLGTPGDSLRFDQEIRQRHSWLSFQKPDKVADALRLVTNKVIWEEVGARLGIPAADVKTRLSAIADRRNQIAHEGDLDPTDPSKQSRWSITPNDAAAAVEFLEQIGRAITEVVA